MKILLDLFYTLMLSVGCIALYGIIRDGSIPPIAGVFLYTIYDFYKNPTEWYYGVK